MSRLPLSISHLRISNHTLYPRGTFKYIQDAFYVYMSKNIRSFMIRHTDIHYVKPGPGSFVLAEEVFGSDDATVCR